MPELTAFVSERPQPKPRLSLLLTPSDDLSGNPVYQNAIYSRDDDDRDRIPNNCSSLTKDVPKPKPRRRSSLDLHLFNEKTYGKTRTCALFEKLQFPAKTTQVLVYKDECDNVCSKDNKNKQSIAKHVNSALCNFNFQHNRNCPDEAVRWTCDNDVENNLKTNSSLIDGVSPIKCMPYNSPRLTKAPRGQDGTMQGKTDVKTSALPKAVTANRSIKSNSTNSELATTRHQSLAAKNVPCRSERGAVSTYNQLKKPSFKKLEEVSSLKENDSSSCSSTSSLCSIGETRRRTSSTSSSTSANTIERRKSAAVPPQLVANLTSKFNALISENHTKTNCDTSVVDIKKRNVNGRGSTLPTFQSCPSSPLRSHVASTKSAIKQTKEIYSKDTKLPKLNSTISRSVESVKIKEKSDVRNKIQPGVNGSVPVKPRSPVAVKKKSFVQQAVLNYEVTLTSNSSSPELPRRNSLPKRSFSISDETRNDSFASPVLLRRMLLNAAEARAAKFTSECNHDDEPRRVADTNPRINQAPQRASNGPQEMPKTAGGGIELRCSSLLSRSCAALKEGRKSPIQQVTNNASNKSTAIGASDDGSRLVKTQKQIVTSTMTTTKLMSNRSLYQSTVAHDSTLNSVNIRKDVVVSTGKNIETILKVSEKAPSVSAVSKGRELMDRRTVSVLNADNKLSVSDVCRDGNKIKATPPPLPTTQPRQINRTNLRRSISKDTNAKRSFLHSTTTEKCNDARKENTNEQSSTNSQNSFLHSKLTSGNVVDACSRETTRKKSLEFIAINHSNVDSKPKGDGSTPNVANNKSDNFKTSFLHAGNVVDSVDSKNESEQCLRTEIKVGSPTMEKKLVIEKSNYVPNTSFLWREMKTTTTTTTTVSHCSIPPPPNSAPPPIPEEYFDQNESNIYDDVVSPCSEELYDEPLYSDAVVLPRHYQIDDEEDCVRKSKKISDKRESNTNNDSDEGWVDVSDTETEGNWHEKNASLSLNNRLKSGSRKNAAKRNSLARRSSWCQPDVNKIDSSKIPMNSAPEEYADFDDDFTDSDESNSTNPDHHYEALYELNQHKLKLEKTVNFVSESSELLIKGADCILEEESPEDAETKQFATRSSLTIDSNFNGGDKKEKRLKRNWSLTKSDIRLELTSRLNKIRIKKTSTSASDVHSVEASVANDNKKSKPWSIRTRFSRKGYDPPSPTKKSPSPKKESALFYVPNCVPITDVICKTDINAENPRVIGCNSSTSVKGPRRASAGNVVRPREAPPAPPTHAKLRADSLSSVDSLQSKQYLPSISSDGELVQENDNYSRFSGSELNSMRSVDSDTESSRTRSTDMDRKFGGAQSLSRSNSTVSSENDKTIFFPMSPRTRTSIASTDSNDSYNFMDSVEPSLLQQISDSLKQAAQRRSFVNPDNTNSSNSSDEEIYEEGHHQTMKSYDFDDEPLYQFYTEAAHKRATDMNCLDASDDEYEAIAKIESNPVLTSTTPAMDLLEPTKSGHRSLWGDLNEVRRSGILEKMTPHDRSLQEAMFEVVTSEASYLKSLNILVYHFMDCEHFIEHSSNCVLSKRDRHLLFSDVLPVKEVSEKLLSDLEKRWQENVVMTDICDILLYHAEHNFSVFIKYCSHQVYQERILKELTEKTPQFVEVLRGLESSPKCQSLTMHSFLMLPMQRITRLPLLVDAIFHRLHEGTKEYEMCQRALQKLNSIVHACNEEARKMARMEEMMVIAQSLKFRDIRRIPIMSASRWVIKQGELQRQAVQDASSKLGFARRPPKHPIYAFLFTDLFVITKKKAEKNEFNVIDHCQRNLLQVSEVTDGTQCKNIYFKLIMLQNYESKTVEMILSCPKESDRTRWIEAIQPKISENPDEKIYEEWDCPQVQAIHKYTAQQADELSFEISDVINVLKKVADGWYQGVRLRDGAQGWFPSNYAKEIVSHHVRARNLRQRYRFLQCLDEQHKETL